MWTCRWATSHCRLRGERKSSGGGSCNGGGSNRTVRGDGRNNNGGGGKNDESGSWSRKTKRRPRASNGQRYPLPCFTHFGNLKCAQGRPLLALGHLF